MVEHQAPKFQPHGKRVNFTCGLPALCQGTNNYCGLEEDGETMGDGSAKPAPPKSVHAQQEQRAGRAKCAADLDGVQPVGSPAPVERDLALAEEGNRTGRCHESIGSWESTEALCVFGPPRPSSLSGTPGDVNVFCIFSMPSQQGR